MRMGRSAPQITAVPTQLPSKLLAGHRPDVHRVLASTKSDEGSWTHTRWPHTYQNCVAGTCRGADQIKSNMPCVEGIYHEGGAVYKKFGANLKVRALERGSEEMTIVEGTSTENDEATRSA